MNGFPVPGTAHSVVAVAAARYLDVVALPGGGCRIYYEWPLRGESHELRTELIPA